MKHNPRRCRLCSPLRHPAAADVRRALASIILPRQAGTGMSGGPA